MCASPLALASSPDVKNANNNSMLHRAGGSLANGLREPGALGIGDRDRVRRMRCFAARPKQELACNATNG